MPNRKFSVLIVDEDREVRESLGELFREADYDVNSCGNAEEALLSFPEGVPAAWPHVVILGKDPRAGVPGDFLASIRERHPAAIEHVSVIAFPSFRVSLPGQTGPTGDSRPVQACRLSTVSSLFTLVRGLERRRKAS
jgi:hypothetical protein